MEIQVYYLRLIEDSSDNPYPSGKELRNMHNKLCSLFKASGCALTKCIIQPSPYGLDKPKVEKSYSTEGFIIDNNISPNSRVNPNLVLTVDIAGEKETLDTVVIALNREIRDKIGFITLPIINKSKPFYVEDDFHKRYKSVKELIEGTGIAIESRL